MKTVAFCEIEEFPRKVLAKHWPDVPIYEDVRTLTRERLESDGVTGVDVICGGFPCQDVSNSGSKLGLGGERSGLWCEMARLVRELRPRFVLVENVRALLVRGIDTVLGDLAGIGYDAEWHCIPASAVGAPHRRDRIWILAYPNGFRQSGQGPLVDARRPEKGPHREASRLVDAFRAQALPFLCRGHDGVSNELGQAGLTALGNAVHPGIPELIGKAVQGREK